MYEHNALGYWSGLALCLTKVRSSRACCPATALIFFLHLLIAGCDIGVQMFVRPSTFWSKFGFIFISES